MIVSDFVGKKRYEVAHDHENEPDWNRFRNWLMIIAVDCPSRALVVTACRAYGLRRSVDNVVWRTAPAARTGDTATERDEQR